MKKIIFIFVAILCVLCIASCTKIQKSDKTEEIDKWAYIYEIENFGYGDSSKIDWSPYENPYEYDVYESPEAELYFDLDSNGAIAMCKAAKELSEKGIECEPIRTDTFSGGKATFFHDPDGLPLEIHE